ncbi:hypothetical protein [Actinoplanes sp. NPDC051411]|uniref:hypothetical protein n=1 Tax=Actinoplanes sp. NPDC051411 TaxID=3155522 RepID=UPI00344406A3
MTTPRLIGGEMMVWSDLDGRHGAGPPSAATLRPLLGAASGRTLVAGPHGLDLIASVPSSPLTLLVRGLADADFLAERLPGATVLCGSLDKLAAAPAFDTVIALDGLGRLRSAEDEAAGTSWADDLARLVSVLAPGGRLLLGVENLFGLHRMLALPPSPSDSDWGDGADEYDLTRPASPELLGAALGALGLEVRASYGAFPAAGEPSLLVSTSVLADRSVRGWATAAIRTAFDQSRSAAPADPSGSGAFADPGRIAAGALRAGIGAELACGWVVLAQGPSDAPAPGLPQAIAGEAVITGDLPTGPTLDELLLAASLRRDLPALRELLAAWQSGPDAGVPADRIVVAPDGTRTPLVPPVRPGTAALARLAATMIREGHAYLWPAPADQAELTALLAAMAGLPPAELPALEPERPAPDLREALMERDRLTLELGEARAKQEWYEKMLRAREAELKRVRRVNTMLMATLPGKAAKASYGGLRAAKRALRKLKG